MRVFPYRMCCFHTKRRNIPETVLPRVLVGKTIESTEDVQRVAREISKHIELATQLAWPTTVSGESSPPFQIKEHYHGIPILESPVTGEEWFQSCALKKGAKHMLAISVPVKGDPDSWYQFIQTAEGYRLLDPYSKVEDFRKVLFGPVEYGRNGEYAQIEYAKVSPPWPIQKRDFTVINMFEPVNHSFTSTTIHYPKFSGRSLYDEPSGVGPQNGKSGHIRATSQVCYYICNSGDAGTEFRILQWFDSNGWISRLSDSANLIDLRLTIDRLQKHPGQFGDQLQRA